MKWCLVLCAVCGFVFPASALDREAFTFSKYDLNVRIEPAQQRLGARGTITLRNDSNAPQRNVVLQISSTLDWRAIRANGQPVAFISQPYTSDIDHTGALSEAIITLTQPVPPRGTLKLEIAYEGTIPLNAARLVRVGLSPDQAKLDDWDQISAPFTAVRGVGYVTWYPIATEAAILSGENSVFDTITRWKAREQHADMRVTITYAGEGVPPAILCNGSAPDVNGPASPQGNDGSVCSYAPLRTTVPLFVLGYYSQLDRGSVNIDYLPADKSDAERLASAAEKAAPFVQSWFGSAKGQNPGEMAKAEFIELPDPAAAPFEDGSLLLTPFQGIDPKLAEMVAVHEFTHAWFYSPRPWIDEGLAVFAQAAYREQQSGRQAALDFLGLHLSAIVSAEKALANGSQPDGSPAESLINTSLAEFYRGKAAYVWWMLRDMVGGPALKKAVAAYRPEQDTSPAYMQHLVEAASHRDLEQFFDDWVYRDRGLPDFRVDSIYSRPLLKEGYLVTVTVDNSGAAGAEVPIKVQMAEGDATKRLLVPANGKASVRVEVPQLPQRIIVNDGSVPESDTTNNIYRVKTAQQK